MLYLAGEEIVRSHHGSVSHEQRRAIEEGLKQGEIRGIVATSSLELGIDMGAVDLVIQIEAPISVARIVGLLGGVHCVGMCGGIVGALSLGIPERQRRGAARWRFLLSYNLGRLISYTLAGALLGGIGWLASNWGGLHEIQRYLQLIAALFMVALGLYLGGWWQALTVLERAGGILWARLEPLGRHFLPIRSPLHALLLGLVWDRRDHEASPHKGVWSEVLARWIPVVPGNDFDYVLLTEGGVDGSHTWQALDVAYRLGLFMGQCHAGTAKACCLTFRGEIAGSIVLLVGAFFIGWITGQQGMTRIEPFIGAPFQGVLCLFLLDMGLIAGRGLRRSWGALGGGALAFGMVMPLLASAVGLGAASLLGLSLGGTVLMMILAASASYIAVPAAMRVALPEADPSIYLTLSLGVTFPFNLALGIPLYYAAALAVTGGA